MLEYIAQPTGSSTVRRASFSSDAIAINIAQATGLISVFFQATDLLCYWICLRNTLSYFTAYCGREDLMNLVSFRDIQNLCGVLFLPAAGASLNDDGIFQSQR